MVRGGFRLTSDELYQFRDRGFLVLRRVLNPAGCARAVDRMWSCMPPGFRRDSPFSWRGLLTDCEGTLSLRRRQGHFQVRDESWFGEEWQRLLPANPIVFAVACELLGHGLVDPPERIRGLYPVFPTWSLLGPRPQGHLDRGIFQLGALAYLDDVKAGGGGLVVWPGSHKDFHMQFHRHVGDGPRPGIPAALQAWSALPGVEITGQAGDVIFYHHRLLHASGRNRRLSVRQAMLAEFALRGIRGTLEEPPPRDLWWYWPGLRERVADLEVPAARRALA